MHSAEAETAPAQRVPNCPESRVIRHPLWKEKANPFNGMAPPKGCKVVQRPGKPVPGPSKAPTGPSSPLPSPRNPGEGPGMGGSRP